MKNNIFPIHLAKDEKLSIEVAKKLFGNSTIDEQRLDLKTVGIWNIIKSIKGLVVSKDFKTGKSIIHGYRTMYNCRQSGYHVEGYVSISGKKYSCFTSSKLLELENGHLIDVGIIFPRLNRNKYEI